MKFDTNRDVRQRQRVADEEFPIDLRIEIADNLRLYVLENVVDDTLSLGTLLMFGLTMV